MICPKKMNNGKCWQIKTIELFELDQKSWIIMNNYFNFNFFGRIMKKHGRGLLVQWKNTRFIKFSFKENVVRFSPRRLLFRRDLLNFAKMFNRTSNYWTSYNLATSIGKCCCDTFYCMKGNVALKIGPMTSS